MIVAATLLLPALAGCASPSSGCEPPFPLVVQAYPMVANASLLEIQTTLWNCTGKPIPLDDPCDARDGMMPALVIDDETYFVGYATNLTAMRRSDIVCPDYVAPTRAVSEPGDYLGPQRYPWDGTYRVDAESAPEAVPPGEYRFFVRAGVHDSSARVDVPWPGRDL